MDEVFDLAKFDEYREDNRLEVKRAKDKLPNALWETYSSFANTAGGCIILGVKERDDKSWYSGPCGCERSHGELPVKRRLLFT